jgi:hypothetical protein
MAAVDTDKQDAPYKEEVMEYFKALYQNLFGEIHEVRISDLWAETQT